MDISTRNDHNKSIDVSEETNTSSLSVVIDTDIDDKDLHGLKSPSDKASASSHINHIPFGMNRFLLLFIIIIYTVCVGSHFFQWSEWESILKKDGAYSELCPSDEICEAQEQKIASLLSLSVLSMFSFTFVAGMVLDVIGPKVCCIFGNSLLISGWILLSLASKTRNTYAIGFALMGAGTDPSFFPTLSIANLFPGYCSTIIAVLGAARSISNVLPFILRLINSSFEEYTFQYMSITFIGMYLLCFVCAILLIPFRPYHVPLKDIPQTSSSVFEVAVIGAAPASHLCQEEFIERQQDTHKAAEKDGLLKDLLKQCKALWNGLLSPLFYPIIALNIVNMIRNNYYLASASKQLGPAIPALTIVNMLAFIPGPILGFAVDKLGPLQVIAGLNTTNMFVFVLLLVGQLSSSTTVTAVMNYSSTVLAFPGIGFLLSQIYCYVSCVFPPEDMGKLCGLASLIAGFCALVVNPMYSWSNSARSFWQMDLLNIVLSLLNYVFIFFLMWKLSRSKV